MLVREYDPLENREVTRETESSAEAMAAARALDAKAKKEEAAAEKSLEYLADYKAALDEHAKYHKLGTIMYIAEAAMMLAVAALAGAIAVAASTGGGNMLILISLCVAAGIGLIASVILARRFDKMSRRSYTRATEIDDDFRAMLEDSKGPRCAMCGGKLILRLASRHNGSLICETCAGIFE